MNIVTERTRYLYKFDEEWLPHSKDNKPAIIYSNGDREWQYKGKRHNANGPAFIDKSGKETYYLEGKKKTKTKWNTDRKNAAGYKPEKKDK